MLLWLCAVAMVLATSLAAAPTKKGARARPVAAKTSAAKTAAVARDWTRVVRRTSAGNFVLGNPAAPVKLVEYLSFTCPHCAAFSAESAAPLKGQMVRSGNVSLELRPAVRDQIDFGATILLRCAALEHAFDFAEAMFAAQNDWLSIGYNFLEHDAARFSLAPPLDQIRAGAQASGLIDVARAQGLSDARINACFADKAGFNQILANADAARKAITGTPNFYINGTKAPASSWGALEPLLVAAGAR
ncbi:MAG: DsbA family protein [Sphingomonas sp.]